MKTIKTTIAILFISIFTFSCSKDDSNKAVLDMNVEDITITTIKVTTPVAPKLGYTGFTSSSWFQLVGNDILYTCASNLGVNNPQFMLKYNLNSNSFQTVTSNDITCACGFSNNFITDNTNAFMIASNARKYIVANDTWSDINYPAAIKNNIGEVGMAYANGKIYACGGRTKTKRFISYNISLNTWSNEKDYIEEISASEMVVVQNKIYLLGGNANNKNFSCFDIALNTWTAKADLTFDWSYSVRDNVVTNVKNRYIFALNNKKVYIYDIVNDKWKKDPITLSVIGKAINLFGYNDTTLLVTSVSDTGDFTLYKLTLNLL